MLFWNMNGMKPWLNVRDWILLWPAAWNDAKETKPGWNVVADVIHWRLISVWDCGWNGIFE